MKVKDLTLLELQQMFRFYMKAMQRKLDTRDIDWLVATPARADYFAALLYA